MQRDLRGIADVRFRVMRKVNVRDRWAVAPAAAQRDNAIARLPIPLGPRIVRFLPGGFNGAGKRERLPIERGYSLVLRKRSDL